MPAISLESMQSTGHGCFPPTPAIGPYTTKSFINGKTVQLLGHTKYEAHTCGIVTHSPDERITSGSSGTFYFEGKLVCRIGDAIACGDTIAEGSSNTFIG